MIALDVECYSNYLLVLFSDGAWFEVHGDGALSEDERRALREKMSGNVTMGFNSSRYDLPMIAYAIAGATTAELKQYSDELITGAPTTPPAAWEHVDIKEPAPGVQVSLKLYGARLNFRTVQDLPIPPGATITADDVPKIRSYCANDVRTTIALYHALLPQVKLRESMSTQYGLDLMSKSDAQIAEAVLVHEIETASGKRIQRPRHKVGAVYRYTVPAIHYASDRLRELLRDVGDARFALADSGAIQMPDQLNGRKIAIGGSVYRLGIGGLHSSEKCCSHYADEDHELVDLDVASYYPSIILNQRLYPAQCGEEFLNVYRSIVERRLAAKRSGDTVTADSLKVTINGSFGKFGSVYSKLSSPKLFIQVTVTGQLCLLWLIESLEQAGIPVVSGNTDGIVTRPRKGQLETLRKIAAAWQDATGFALEETHYRSLHSRDVNNYVAVKTDGKAKCKGVYAAGGLMKNPQNPIVAKAVVEYLTNGTPITETVLAGDVTDYLAVRTVKGGAVWRGQYLGKVARWYWSTSGDAITYQTNGNKVPTTDGSRPMMVLTGGLPDDLDYDRYADVATGELAKLGVSIPDGVCELPLLKQQN